MEKNIEIKRVYDKPDQNDGIRVLVDRFWPRGVRKDKARIELWPRDIAPSTDLRRWFKHDPERWEEFKEKYKRELEENRKVTDVKKKLEKIDRDKVTLLYAAADKEHNHALVLKDFLRANGG